MEATRRILEERKAAGLSADMQFTYRNPVRSTDPSRLSPGAAALVVGAWPYGGGADAGEPARPKAPGRSAQGHRRPVRLTGPLRRPRERRSAGSPTC